MNSTLKMLSVRQRQIVTASGVPVRLRGFNIGGWMNMEDFITGFTGAEHNLRATMSRILGEKRAQIYFERLLDYFFTEADVAYMEQLGANVLRLPFNYRHFERDERPFEYLEEGFRRMDQAVEWCARHNIYVVLDFHATQGWHNPDWHSDNSNVIIQLFSHRQFQDRFIALWEELARRYKGNPAVAGYGLLNEPLTRMEYERYEPSYYDWDALNGLHRRTVEMIRRIDQEHMIFLEGDEFSTQYDELDVTFDDNIVLSSHHYTSPTVSPGAYPGEFDRMFWNRDMLAAEFGMHSGTRLAFKHRLPMFCSEFGVWYTGRLEELEYRTRALDDQLSIFDSAGIHWAIWTFKDVGAMGAINVAPDSDYLRLIDPVLKAKHQAADWEGEHPKTPVAAQLKVLADTIDSSLEQLGLPFPIERQRFAQFTLFGYLAQFLQVPYAHLFKDCTEAQIDQLMQDFLFERCTPNEAIIRVLKSHFQ